MDSATGTIKDKFLAGGVVLILLACYMTLSLWGLDTKFIEGAFLIGLGALVGLLKQTPSPQTNVQSETATTNVTTKGE